VVTYTPATASNDTTDQTTTKPSFFKSPLSRGSKGKDVLLLQKVLIKENFLKVAPSDTLGNFGLKTENAVKQFQCTFSIVCSDSDNTDGWGIVGDKKTYAELDSLVVEHGLASGAPTASFLSASSGITLQQGSRGSSVVTLQKKLIAKGFLVQAPTDVLGLYGGKTVSAVKKFQCNNNIVCSGSPDTTGWGAVGTLTQDALDGLSYSNPTSTKQTTIVLAKGSRGKEVTTLQKFLVSEGLLVQDPSDVLGLYGGKTEAAVKKFQCDHKIICSGSPSTTGWGTVGKGTRALVPGL
jgi:peptidoglycan hydrolase-like protein with peptidoglycan-binding domain